jgi:hypothetical protein
MVSDSTECSVSEVALVRASTSEEKALAEKLDESMSSMVLKMTEAWDCRGEIIKILMIISSNAPLLLKRICVIVHMVCSKVFINAPIINRHR